MERAPRQRRRAPAASCGTRWSYQENALGQPPAEPAVALGRAQEGDDLVQLLLRLVDSGDVVEGNVHLALHVDAGLAAADLYVAAARRHAPYRKYQSPAKMIAGTVQDRMVPKSDSSVSP